MSNLKKKTKLRTAGIAAAVCTVSLALAGCGILPGEEEAHKIQIVKESVENEYDLAMCEKRDVVLTDTVSCQYKQLAEENLSFAEGGKRVAYVYVKEGDEVKAGDLLVKLDIEGYENGLIDMEEMIKVARLTISQADEQIRFYESRINSEETNLLDKENYLKKLREVRSEKTEAENVIEYAEGEIERYRAEIEGGTLVAGIDGTVSYIAKGLVGSTTLPNMRIMTIMDSSACGFQAQDRDAAGYMKVGESYEVVTNNGNAYPVTATQIEPDTGKLVFELDEPDYSISVGTRGNIAVVLGTAEQVPSVPRISVYSADDYSYVYLINENGVREMRKVEIGLQGNNYVEIKSGINLLDSVILR
ncbi:MAG: biotin/lipoyl-binding protein [Lachnospiraceae bacterium]|nr:biotin/lipoyl-binding protein [Lachnospiraceae bacterium]